MNFQEANTFLPNSEKHSQSSLLKISDIKDNNCLISEDDYNKFLSQLETDIKRIASGMYDASWLPRTEYSVINGCALQTPSSDKIFSQGQDSKIIQSFWMLEEASTKTSEEPEQSIQLAQPECKLKQKFDREAFWTEDNKSKLLEWAKLYRHDWKKIAKLFGTKHITASGVRNKYREIKAISLPLRVRFSQEEDQLIAKYYSIYGLNWKKIAEHIPRRSHIMIKNRFYSHIKKYNLIETLLGEGEAGCQKINGV